ncbi:hypothetical protein [Tepidiphilus baoligensis]|uniref:hypothetical protein n=1 Tax=Tepidiphilus baoligensis TaxID=2698687 RepID=UPI001F1A65E6|nr:hypothetical protein [Tepidiphilus baoligensis]
MTKLETVRALNDVGPQLQIVESVRQLQQRIDALHNALEALPRTLQQWETMRPSAQEALDRILEIQRRAIDEMALRLSERASQAFEQKAASLHAKIGTLTQTLTQLETGLTHLEQKSHEIAALPDKLDQAAKEMTRAAEELREAARHSRPSPLKTLLTLLLAGATGALLTGSIHVTLERLIPPSQDQRDAQWARMLITKATAQEREALQRILERSPTP